LQDSYPASQANYDKHYAEWTAKRDAARAAGEPFTTRPPRKPEGGELGRITPSALYNGMIYPLILTRSRASSGTRANPTPRIPISTAAFFPT